MIVHRRTPAYTQIIWPAFRRRRIRLEPLRAVEDIALRDEDIHAILLLDGIREAAVSVAVLAVNEPVLV